MILLKENWAVLSEGRNSRELSTKYIYIYIAYVKYVSWYMAVETIALKKKSVIIQDICVIYLSSEDAILSLFKLTKMYLGKREDVKLYT